DLSLVRRAMINCQSQVNRVSLRFFSELVSFEALEDLGSLQRERQKLWHHWVSGVKDALDRCRQPIDDVNQALFQCWQELSERSNLVSLSVQATSSGQQINIATEKKSQV